MNDEATGMTLRDYFAAKAMHALITEPPWGDGGGTATVHTWSDDFNGKGMERFAFVAYRMADAMLKERAK